MTTSTLEKYETTIKRAQRGEVWNVILREGGKHVQNGERPFLILSNNVGNRFSPVLWGCPLTSKSKKKMPTHTMVEDEGLEQTSIVLAEQPITISIDDLQYKICKLSNESVIRCEMALFVSGDLFSNWDIKLKEAK